MAKVVTTLTQKTATVVSVCLQIFLCSAALTAQRPVKPRGVPQSVPAPIETDREWERISSRTTIVNSPAPDGRETLREIRKDFLKIQILTNELIRAVGSKPQLEYKYISDTAGKIRTLAERLDSNLALGKPEGAGPRAEFEFSETALKSSLRSLHRLVRSFVENPIFKERNVFDIQETKRAKQDVAGIIAVSEQVKKIARKLNKNAGR